MSLFSRLWFICVVLFTSSSHAQTVQDFLQEYSAAAERWETRYANCSVIALVRVEEFSGGRKSVSQFDVIAFKGGERSVAEWKPNRAEQAAESKVYCLTEENGFILKKTGENSYFISDLATGPSEPKYEFLQFVVEAEALKFTLAASQVMPGETVFDLLGWGELSSVKEVQTKYGPGIEARFAFSQGNYETASVVFLVENDLAVYTSRIEFKKGAGVLEEYRNLIVEYDEPSLDGLRDPKSIVLENVARTEVSGSTQKKESIEIESIRFETPPSEVFTLGYYGVSDVLASRGLGYPFNTIAFWLFVLGIVGGGALLAKSRRT